MTNELTMTQYLQNDVVQKSIKDALQDRAQQFVTSMVSLVNSSERLKTSDKKSLLGACLTAASLNLPINQNLGFAWIIPYNNKIRGENGEPDRWVSVAQFQLGYKGFIQLAMRSKQFKTLNVTDVREGELKSFNHLSGEPKFKWTKDFDERLTLPIIGYVAYMKLTNGFEKSLYMTAEQLKAHGIRFSKTAKKKEGLWFDDFDSMAKKTVLKQLLSKYAPMDTDMAKAQEYDQAVITDGKPIYLDNTPVDPEEEAEQKEHNRIKAFIENAKTIGELELCSESVEDPNSVNSDLIDLYNEKKKELSKK